MKHYLNRGVFCGCCVMLGLLLVGCPEVPEEPSAPEQVIYVNKAVGVSKGEQDGLSWATAFSTLQAGIDAAYEAGWDWEVWVAQGIYDEERVDESNTAGMVRLRNEIAVYGGFLGNEISMEARDWENNETVISGLNGRGAGLPAFHVVYGADNAVLDGFTVSGGAADHPDNGLYSRWGGGIGNRGVAPTYRNCIIRDNTAVSGGGMYNVNSYPIISNCTFIDNTAVYSSSMGNSNSTVYIQGCSFEGVATYSLGTELEVGSSDVYIRDSQIGGNDSELGDYSIYGYSSYVSVVNSVIRRNVYTYSAVYDFDNCVLLGLDGQGRHGDIRHIENSIIIGGSVGVLNSIQNSIVTGVDGSRRTVLSGTDVTATNCLLVGNRLVNTAAVVNVGGEDSVVSNNTIVANSSEDRGICFIGYEATPLYSNCIVWRNESDKSIIELSLDAAPTIAYSLIQGGYDDGVHGATVLDGDPQFVGEVVSGIGESIVYDPETGQSTLVHGGEFTPGTLENLIVWVDADNDGTPERTTVVAAHDGDQLVLWGDFSGSTTRVYSVWDYGLRSTSPAVDSGADTSTIALGAVTDDLWGVPRPLDGDGLGTGGTGDGSDYDMGAFEYVP